MGMSPSQYFAAFVEPNSSDYRQYPGDIRLAFNAAISTSHFADHYFNFSKKHEPHRVAGFKTMGDFVEFLASETNGAFRDIRSMANAYKHLYNSDGPSAKYECINSCGSIEMLRIDGGDEIVELDDGVVPSLEGGSM